MFVKHSRDKKFYLLSKTNYNDTLIYIYIRQGV